MEILLYIVLALCLLVTVISWIITKDLFNPIIITLFFWATPIFFSSLRLSGLQATYWSDKTYLLLIYSLLAFMIFPGIIIVFLKRKMSNRAHQVYRLSKIINKKVVVLLSFTTITAYFLENYIASNSLIPALTANSNIDVHTVSVSGLLIITRSFIPLTATFLYLCYKDTHKKYFVLLMSLILILPITRLGRFDIVMSLIPLGGIMFEFIKNKRKFLINLLIVALILAIGGASLGEYRMNQGNNNDITYAQGIQYQAYSGPSDTFAVLYGYFALSVENLDRFIKVNYNFENYQYGAFILRPITVGLFKFNNIFEDYPMYEFVNKFRDPLIGYATVHTALVDFSMDFGYGASIFIMLLFSFIGLILYIKSLNSIVMRIYYLLYAQAFAFLSFQNLFIEARLLYQLLLAHIVIQCSQKIYKKEIAHRKEIV